MITLRFPPALSDVERRRKATVAQLMIVVLPPGEYRPGSKGQCKGGLESILADRLLSNSSYRLQSGPFSSGWAFLPAFYKRMKKLHYSIQLILS